MFKMLDIHGIMNDLSERRPIFHLEADFQFALAWRIKELMPECEIRLESKPFANEGMYLDIWLPTIHTAIELKYRTRELGHEFAGEQFALKEQGAQPLSRYDFVKDIERIERIVAEKSDCNSGLAVLLTNDAAYWKSPSEQWQTTMDSQFRLHEDSELGGILKWKDGTNPRTIRGREEPLILKGSYELRWQDYSRLGNGNRMQFRYLAVSVGA